MLKIDYQKNKTQKKKLIITTLTVVAAMISLISYGFISVSAKPAAEKKVDICHLEGNGSYHLVNVSTNAVQAHLDHGDGLLDNSVTRGDDIIFNSDCSVSLVKVDSVQVPVTSGVGIESNIETVTGTNYLLVASGTYRYQSGTTYGIADAEWAKRNDAYKDNPPAAHGWTLGENTYGSPTTPPKGGLDILVDNTNIYWGDFNDDHIYQYDFAGTGNKIFFNIYDSAYGDNSNIGDGMKVDIYEQQ